MSSRRLVQRCPPACARRNRYRETMVSARNLRSPISVSDRVSEEAVIRFEQHIRDDKDQVFHTQRTVGGQPATGNQLRATRLREANLPGAATYINVSCTILLDKHKCIE